MNKAGKIATIASSVVVLGAATGAGVYLYQHINNSSALDALSDKEALQESVSGYLKCEYNEPDLVKVLNAIKDKPITFSTELGVNSIINADKLNGLKASVEGAFNGKYNKDAVFDIKGFLSAPNAGDKQLSNADFETYFKNGKLYVDSSMSPYSFFADMDEFYDYAKKNLSEDDVKVLENLTEIIAKDLETMELSSDLSKEFHNTVKADIEKLLDNANYDRSDDKETINDIDATKLSCELKVDDLSNIFYNASLKVLESEDFKKLLTSYATTNSLTLIKIKATNGDDFNLDKIVDEGVENAIKEFKEDYADLLDDIKETIGDSIKLNLYITDDVKLIKSEVICNINEGKEDSGKLYFTTESLNADNLHSNEKFTLKAVPDDKGSSEIVVSRKSAKNGFSYSITASEDGNEIFAASIVEKKENDDYSLVFTLSNKGTEFAAGEATGKYVVTDNSYSIELNTVTLKVVTNTIFDLNFTFKIGEGSEDIKLPESNKSQMNLIDILKDYQVKKNTRKKDKSSLSYNLNEETDILSLE